jgi:hypothetical protein
MQSFPVAFSRSRTVVFILISVPLLIAFGIIIPLATWSRVPDWAPMPMAIAACAVSIGSVLLLYKRYAAIPADAELHENGISIRLRQPSPFYRRSYAAEWSAVSNASSNVDMQHGKRFYLVTFRDSGATVQLMPDEPADESSETAFGRVLLSYVSSYNEKHTSQPETLIRQRGFYDAWWAKALTGFALLALPGGIVLYAAAPEMMEGWRLLQIASFSVAWLVAYYANKRSATRAIRRTGKGEEKCEG